jgi:hypothetical protein
MSAETSTQRVRLFRRRVANDVGIFRVEAPNVLLADVLIRGGG